MEPTLPDHSAQGDGVEHNKTADTLRDMVLSQAGERAYATAQQVAEDASPAKILALKDLIPEATSRALDLAMTYRSPADRYGVLGGLGECALDSEQVDKLLDALTLDEIPSSYKDKEYYILKAHGEALVELAPYFVQAGREAELLSKFTDAEPFEHDKAISLVAKQLAESGKGTQALEYAQKFGSKYSDGSGRSGRSELMAAVIEADPAVAHKAYEVIQKDIKAQDPKPVDWSKALVTLAVQEPEEYANTAYEYITESPDVKYYAYKDAQLYTELASILPDDKALAVANRVLTEYTDKVERFRKNRYSIRDSELSQERERVTVMLDHLVGAGRYEIASRVGNAIDGSYDKIITKKIVEAAIEAGEPLSALQAASHAEYGVADTYSKTVEQLAERDQIDEALAIAASSEQGDKVRAEVLASTLHYRPDLLDDTLASLEAIKHEDVFGNGRTLRISREYQAMMTKVLPALLAEERYDVFDEISEDSGGQLTAYLEVLPDRPDLLDRAKYLLATVGWRPEHKVKAYAQLAKFDKSLASKALELEKDPIKLGDEGYNNAMRSVTRKLLESECYDEAKIALERLDPGYYLTVAPGLLPHYPEMAPEIARRLVRQTDRSGYKLETQEQAVRQLFSLVSDEQLLPTLSIIAEGEQAWPILGSLKIAAPRMVEQGHVDDLLRIILATKDKQSRSAGNDYIIEQITSDIAPSLIEAGRDDVIVSTAQSLGRDTPRLRLLQQSLGDSTVVAGELLRMVNDGEVPYTLEIIDSLTAILPLEPNALPVLLEKSQDLKPDAEAFVKVLDALTQSGYNAEALEVIQRGGYHARKDFLKYLPSIINDERTMVEAYSYARQLPATDQAKAMTIIAIAYSRQPSKPDDSARHELFGPQDISKEAHAESDRSINYQLFVADIAENPVYIELLMPRTKSPAEIGALLKAVDAAAEISLNPTRVRQTALNQLVMKTDNTVMARRFKEERQKKSDGEEGHDIAGFKYLPKLRQLAANVENTSEHDIQNLLEGYSVSNLYDHPWLVTGDIVALGEDRFPANGPKGEQFEWLADHSFSKMPGFNKRTIGQIIANRLSTNIEYTLHDASQWLNSFSIPENHMYFDQEKGEMIEVQLYDDILERDLIASLLQGEFGPEELRRLPGYGSGGGDTQELKTQKFEPLFHNSANTLLYAAIMQSLATSTNGKVDVESVKNYVDTWENNNTIRDWVGQSKGLHTYGTESKLVERALAHLEHSIANEVDAATKPTEIVSQLRSLGKERKNYVDSTTSWLRNYQNLSGRRLERVWQDRPGALQDGVEDTPTEIYAWSMTKGLRNYLKDNTDPEGNLPSGVNAEAMLKRFDNFVPELVVRYSGEQTAQALERLWAEANPEADLPAYDIALSGGYTFKIFSKDDPAGMTIGHDTDCCMTLGGQSSSCIYTGYSDPRAGFVGLYDANDKLVAQSFVWHNNGVLVLDNIEAQRGHNVGRIQGLYSEALSKYLPVLHEQKPELEIQAVHIGTGYMDSKIAAGLKTATPVPMPFDNYVYTDSRSQIELLRYTTEELDAANPDVSNVTAIARRRRELTNPPATEAEVISISDPEAVVDTIASLEAQIYPQGLTQGRSELLDCLQQYDDYSFMIGSRRGNSEVVGYLIAFRDPRIDAVYVSDLAILPEEQRNGYGIDAMKYLLSLVNESGERRVVFEARETTSYRALTSASGQALLAEYGFVVADSQLKIGYFPNGESAYEVTLEKAPARELAMAV